MEKITIYKDENYNQQHSERSKFIVIQLVDIKPEKLESVIKEIKSESNYNYFEQPGIYFLEEVDGFYIGETKSLSNRLSTHLEHKNIKSITFATTKSAIDIMDKTEITDIESVLIQIAKDCGFKLEKTLKNKLDEQRKSLNNITFKQNKESAKYIWECFLMFNANGILRYFANGGGVKGAYSNHAPKENKYTNLDFSSTKKPFVKSTTEFIKKSVTVDLAKPLIPNKDHEIFKYAKIKEATNRYKFGKVEIFSREIIKDVFFDFMVSKIASPTIETKYLGMSEDGYIVSRALSYYGINSSGNFGCLKNLNPTEAKALISAYIESLPNK